jgi:hypothetical protein
MPLSPLGVIDLSVVTDRLIAMLTECVTKSPLWVVLEPGNPNPKPNFGIAISGSMPETNRKDSGCTLSICLIHVSADKYQRNFVAIPPPPPPAPPPPPQRALLIPSQPLALDLYYLLTAFDADNSYVHEQQVMSIALKCFHENPFVRTTVAIPPPPQTVQEEFTLTMELQTSDDVARLWQAITVPYRLSVFYKVSVVFLTPPAPAPGAKQAARFTLAVDPASFPFAGGGQVIGTSSTQTFTSPKSTVAQPEIVNTDYSPALVTPSPSVITPATPVQRLFVYGGGLNQKTSSQIYLLLPPDYRTEQEVTVWRSAAGLQTQSRIALDVPNTIAPGGAPAPGIYQVRAGSDLAPNQNRTNGTPFSLAARVDVTVAPPNPPVLAGPPPYTVKGMGFIAGQTQVLLETVALAESPTPPPAGRFSVIDIQTIVFQPPAGLPAGLYGLRIRVNQVESPPSWWVQV